MSHIESTATFSGLDNTFPRDTRILVYIDGSAHSIIKKRGAGALAEYPYNTANKIYIPTGNYCNNYDA